LAPEGLLSRVDSDDWRRALKGASRVAEQAVKDEPELRFEYWGKELGPNAQDMISGMTNPDPTARTTIEEVMKHPWWKEDS